MKQKGGKVLRGSNVDKPNPFEEYEKELRNKQSKKERRKENRQTARGKKRPLEQSEEQVNKNVKYYNKGAFDPEEPPKEQRRDSLEDDNLE